MSFVSVYTWWRTTLVWILVSWRFLWFENLMYLLSPCIDLMECAGMGLAGRARRWQSWIHTLGGGSSTSPSSCTCKWSSSFQFTAFHTFPKCQDVCGLLEQTHESRKPVGIPNSRCIAQGRFPLDRSPTKKLTHIWLCGLSALNSLAQQGRLLRRSCNLQVSAFLVSELQTWQMLCP